MLDLLLPLHLHLRSTDCQAATDVRAAVEIERRLKTHNHNIFTFTPVIVTNTSILVVYAQSCVSVSLYSLP